MRNGSVAALGLLVFVSSTAIATLRCYSGNSERGVQLIDCGPYATACAHIFYDHARWGKGCDAFDCEKHRSISSRFKVDCCYRDECNAGESSIANRNLSMFLFAVPILYMYLT